MVSVHGSTPFSHCFYWLLSGNIRASGNKKRQDTGDLIINTPPSPVIHVAT